MNTIKERTLFRGKLLDRADNYYPEEKYIKSLDNDLKTMFPESDFKYGYDRLDCSHVFWFNKKTEKIDNYIIHVLNDYYRHGFKSTLVFIDNNDPIGLA
jgi:hypothetical protein